jgi:hypothetical protein
LIAKGHISLVISLLKKYTKSGVLCLNIIPNPHLPSVVVGYIDLNSSILSGSVYITVELVQYQKSLRRR